MSISVCYNFIYKIKSDNIRVSNPRLLIHWVASQPNELKYAHVQVDIKITIKTHWLLFAKFVSDFQLYFANRLAV